MPRPRPVLIYGAVIAALETLLGIADLGDMLPEKVIDWLRIVVVVLVAIGGAFGVQSRVTPLSAPQDASGTPLVPEDSIPVRLPPRT
jgi:hypothetical protein